MTVNAAVLMNRYNPIASLTVFYSSQIYYFQYCNGILRANVDYKVKLRAYLENKVAMESDWISIDGSADEEEEEDKNGECGSLIDR